MWPWSGVCARSPPRMTAHSQHVHFCPLHLLWSSSQSLLLGGLIHLLLPGLLSHSPVSGIIQKSCHSEVDLVSRHQGGFPGSHSPPACPLPAQTRKAASGPEPHGSAWALTPLQPGPSLSSPLQSHQELSPPRAGCLLCPGEASVVTSIRNNRFLWGLPHTAQWPAPTY